jgi:hypothetical protein
LWLIPVLRNKVIKQVEGLPGGRMKKAGDLLSAIIDEKTIHRARGYSKLFRSWEWLTKKYRIAAAADHSRIKDLNKNILIVEADHPGWIQILQTKEHRLLEELRAGFPDLDIQGISIRLSREPPAPGEEAAAAGEPPASETSAPPPEEIPPGASEPAYEKIKDPELRESLASLEKNINARWKK